MAKRQSADGKPPKVTRGETTGIYNPVHAEPASRSTADQQRFLREHVFGLSIAEKLDAIERDAQHFIDLYACPKMKAAKGCLSETKTPEPGQVYHVHDLADDAPPVARDASDVLLSVTAVRACLKNGDASNAVFNALQLGQTYERMLVRQFEPITLTGRKVKAGARKGHVEVHGTTQAKAERWLEYCREVDARRRPGVKLETTYSQVAKKFSVSVKTVYRALKRRQSLDTARHCPE